MRMLNPDIFTKRTRSSVIHDQTYIYNIEPIMCHFTYSAVMWIYSNKHCCVISYFIHIPIYACIHCIWYSNIALVTYTCSVGLLAMVFGELICRLRFAVETSRFSVICRTQYSIIFSRSRTWPQPHTKIKKKNFRGFLEINKGWGGRQ